MLLLAIEIKDSMAMSNEFLEDFLPFRAFFKGSLFCQKKQGDIEIADEDATEAGDEEVEEDDDMPLHHMRCKFALPYDFWLQEDDLVSNLIASNVGKMTSVTVMQNS